jgi:dienelactone hydrolase
MVSRRTLPVVITLLIAAVVATGVALRPSASRTEPTMHDPVTAGPFRVSFSQGSVSRILSDGSTRAVQYDVFYPLLGPRTRPEVAVLANFPVSVQSGGQPAPGKLPLIVFSHGTGGDPVGFTALTTHLASQGFIVAAPYHRDCDFGCNAAGELQSRTPVILRPDDVKAVIDNLVSKTSATVRVDSARIGLVGFSFGGYTALAEMQSDQRVRAAVLLAPNTFLRGGSTDPARVSRPLLFMQGEWDSNIPITNTYDFFEKIPVTAPERWFIELQHAGHFIPTNDCFPQRGGVPPCVFLMPQRRSLAIIKSWATPFLMAYVAGDKQYLKLIEDGAGQSSDITIVRSDKDTPPAKLPAPSSFSR